MKYVIRFACLIFFLLMINSLTAQVAIAPSALFINDQTNIGTLYISNRSDDTQEISIDFVFGYPSADGFGNTTMKYDDSLAFEKYAINDWVRVFPRSFVLGPRQQQTVRFQVRPQPQIEDGVYWTRVRIAANPQAQEIDVPAEEGVTTRITFRFEQVIAALYRKGQATTGVVVNKVDVQHEEDRMILLPHLERTGNAPFIGSMTALLYDSQGNLVRERQSTTTAYFDVIRRIELDTSGVPSGIYRVELVFETRRGDISPTDLVQARPVREFIEVNIP